jgi:hypothetical protein
MTKLSKVLVVFTTVMSLAFLAFIGVTAIGGPNWLATAQGLDGYTIERTGGENPTWKVTERVTGKDLGAKPYLPQAIKTAQDDRIQAQQQRLTALDEEINRVKQTIEAEKPTSDIDAAGIEARFAELTKTLGDLDQEILRLTREGTEQAQQAEALRAEAAARRDDVARLQTELSQVRTDRYRVEEQITQLHRRLIRLRGQIDRAARRQEQLRGETTPDYDEAAGPSLGTGRG